MKLYIETQVYENYGSHDWNGVGQCPQYWKAKGSNDYMVKDIDNNEAATAAVMALRSKIECDTDYFRETIINWCLVKNNYITESEKFQLELDGKITFKSVELVW